MRFVWIGVGILTTILSTASPVVATAGYKIDSYRAEYRLGRDSENRSTLDAKVTIEIETSEGSSQRLEVPKFTKTVNRHDTGFRLHGVSDQSGRQLKYHWRDDQLSIDIVGRQTVVISYSQRDVTQHFPNNKLDEFDWNVIGYGWPVALNDVVIEATVGDGLIPQQGWVYCQKNAHGSQASCLMGKNKTHLKQRIARLPAGDAVSVRLGFRGGTFAAYQKTFWQRLLDLWGMAQVPAALVALAAIVWMKRLVGRMTRRDDELGELRLKVKPPQYSILTVGKFMMAYGGEPNYRLMAAWLLDLAIRRYIQLRQMAEPSDSEFAVYELKVLQPLDDLYEEEREVLAGMFGQHLPSPGEFLPLKLLRHHSGYGKYFLSNQHKLEVMMRGQYGLTEQRPEHQRVFRWFTAMLGMLAAVTLSIPLLAAVIVAWRNGRKYSLSDKGLELRRHLLGLQQAVGSSIEDAIVKVVDLSKDSPDDATADLGSITKNIEMLLPYAVLFDQTNNWAALLANGYLELGRPPAWLSKNGSFSIESFVKVILDFQWTTWQYLIAANKTGH